MLITLVWISAGLLAASIVLSIVRLFLGPTTPDRIIAADTLSVITTILLVCISVIFDSSLYLDVTLVYGALAFVGVVALARLLEHNA